MSVETLDQPVQQAGQPARRDDFESPQFNEFNYRPVPITAVAGLVLALISSISLFLWLALPLCLLAILLSTAAWFAIRGSGGAYGGRGVALSGIILASTFLLGGIAFQIYQFQTEIPEGYQRVSFLNDISVKQFVQRGNQITIHPDVAALQGKEVFIKGYMYQGREKENLNRFMFVKDNKDCCFGADVKPWDQLWVTLKDNKTINLESGRVAFIGRFKINPEWNPGDKESPLYELEGERLITRIGDF